MKLELMNLSRLFLTLIPLIFQLESHASEDKGGSLVRATAALSRSDWKDGVEIIQEAVGSPLREVQPSDTADASDVPAEFFGYRRVLKPTRSGTGIQWLTVHARDPRRAVTSLKPDAMTCVRPSDLELALESKALFISPPPLHGGPPLQSPGTFLPGTHWSIRVLHSVKPFGATVPLAFGTGFRVEFVIRPEKEPCVLQLNFIYGGMLVPLGK